MNIRTSLKGWLPASCRDTLDRVPDSVWERVQEVRLRAGDGMRLVTSEEVLVLPDGLSATQMEECFWRLSGQAVHTHSHELKEGYVTTADGFRVGIGGTAVVREDGVHTYRQITSLCIRIPRHIPDAAASLMPFVTSRDGILHGMLLCGAPGSGKTTLLRSIAERLSDNGNVTVVDERSELALNALRSCDVLRGCPKSVGILQAVRSLSPDIIVADELGSAKDWTAVEQSVHCGVPLICSAHIGSEEEARVHPMMTEWLRRRVVDYVVFLPPRRKAFEPARIWKVEDFLEDRRDRMSCVCLRDRRDHSGASPAADASPVGSVGDVASTAVSGSSVHVNAVASPARFGQQNGSDGAELAVGV